MPQKFLFELSASEIVEHLRMTSQSAALETLCSTSSVNQSDCAANLLYIKTVSISDKRHCTLCDCDFCDRDQQTEHYQLDWHRFNLKRKLCGLHPVVESEFNSLTQDKSDMSSISGSESDFSDDSDSDEKSDFWSKCFKSVDSSNEINSLKSNNVQANQRVHLRLFFRNSSGTIFSLYRCLIFGKGGVSESETSLVEMANKLFANFRWAVILIGGGHFAAGIFDKNELIEHKTFHRYTVRAKQGSAQGMRDAKHGGSHPKSAGASLRRHNESALVADIQMLMSSWAEQLHSCSLIFFRAPSFNRAVLFSNKNPPFKKDDGRLRNISFATRRATLREVKRVHRCLSSVEVIPEELKSEYLENQQVKDETHAINHKNLKAKELIDEKLNKDVGIAVPQEEKVLPTVRKKKKKRKNVDDQHEKHQFDPDPVVIDAVNDDNEYKIFNRLYTLCKSGECKGLNDLISKIENYTGDDAISSSKLLNKQFGETNVTLLHLSAKIGVSEIVKTLLYRGANPSLINMKCQTPYMTAKNDAIRSVFKEFKMENPNRYDYDLAKIPDLIEVNFVSSKKKKKPKSKKISNDKNIVHAVTMATAKNPCTMCSKDLSKLVPFECYNLKFCSTNCVRKFRTRQVK